MVATADYAEVVLWGDVVGAVAWAPADQWSQEHAVFEFEPAFLKKGLDVSPIHMGLEEALGGERIFSFPALSKGTYHGLPGLLADSLPDKFGNALIDAWLARSGRDPGDFTSIERLCYTGKRGMGALEFKPASDPGNKQFSASVPVEISELVALTQKIMKGRQKLSFHLGSPEEDANALQGLLQVGTSAGGARPKAVIAMDDQGHVRSGQVEAPEGFEHWILKFDGVSGEGLGDPKGYGRVEYAYHLMAKSCGIKMAECRLFEEKGRAHFMAKRFDRADGEKIHMQSLCGLAHFDFNMAGGYGYEQAFAIMRKLRLSKEEASQQFRRMVFSVASRNNDDHTKNIAFLMDRNGRWSLSPAFDVTCAYNPAGEWTNGHQMTINGKRHDVTRSDLVEVGNSISLNSPEHIISEVLDAVAKWPSFAAEAGVSTENVKKIKANHRCAELRVTQYALGDKGLR